MWWRYLQKPTLVIGFVLGTSVVVVCMFFVQWQWVEKFQGLIGASLAVGAAAWTISLTILHREIDYFQKDRIKFLDFWGEVQSGKLSGQEVLKTLEQFEHFPENVRKFIYWSALANQQNTGRIQGMPRKVASCFSEVNDWFLQCRAMKRYITFNSQLDPKSLCEEMNSANEQFVN